MGNSTGWPHDGQVMRDFSIVISFIIRYYSINGNNTTDYLFCYNYKMKSAERAGGRYDLFAADCSLITIS
jgi:hypothetical protein